MHLLIILFLLLPIISLDEASTNSFLRFYSEDTYSKYFLLFLLFSLQFIAAPIQAGFSDFYCRKKNLILAVIITIGSMALLFISLNYAGFLFLFAFILKACLGNITPIARAGLADTSLKKNFRLSIGLSTVAIGVGYFILVLLNDFLNNSLVIITVLLLTVIGLIFLIIKFKDLRDKDAKTIHGTILNDIRSIFTHFLNNKSFLLALATYAFWETAFYQLFLRDADIKNSNFKFTAVAMCLGYFIGVALLGFSKKSDLKNIKVGCGITLSSFALLIMISNFIQTSLVFEALFYGVAALGYGFFTPSLFSHISQDRQPHEQGKIYGLIDSVDSLAFTVAFFIALITKVTHYYFILFSSFILILVGYFIFLVAHRHLQGKAYHE